MTGWVALLVVLGESAIVLLLLRFVRTFGVYTQTLVEIHHTNLQIQTRQEEILARLPSPPDDDGTLKEVA